ncbi:MAG: lipoate--protein ligase family protein [Firmicutes bacterium]|nr:lipoate--protein ligase family protein [Bacillota bacterium]
MTAWRVLTYQIADPAWNMAVDEAIFIRYLEGISPPTLRFYGWSPPTLSIGYFQDLEREIKIDVIRQKGYGLVRRNTGGRAVLHDRELTYSVIAGVKEGFPDSLIESYLFISRAFIEALRSLGVEAELNQGAAKRGTTGACFESPSWYEITVNGRKLIGSAQLRRQNAFLQHGSILIRFSAADLGAVLNLPDDSSAAYMNMLRAKICCLEELGINLEPSELALKISDSFQKLYGFPFEAGDLNGAELELANSLAKKKYAAERWTYQRGTRHNQTSINGIQAGNG